MDLKMSAPKGFNRTDFKIAILCALPLEAEMMEAIFDKSWNNDQCLSSSDQNTYTLGSIGNHPVVLACLPTGEYGTTSASVAVQALKTTFPEIKICLVVGISGSASVCPQQRPASDIRLGDIVVSSPLDRTGGVVQYDLGIEPQCSDRRDQPQHKKWTKHMCEKTMSEIYPRVHYNLSKNLEVGHQHPPTHAPLDYASHDPAYLDIRGMSDCTGKPRHKQWQTYAMAVSAAFTREVLLNVSECAIAMSPTSHHVLQILISSTKNVEQTIRRRERDKEAEMQKQKLSNHAKHEVDLESRQSLAQHGHRKRIITPDFLKLGSACVLSVGIYLLSSSGWLQEPMFSLVPYSPPTDKTFLYNNYLLAADAALVLAYWTVVYSFIWHNPRKQRYLLYSFWTYAVVFLGGLSLQYSLAMLAVVVLPIAMNIALIHCSLEEPNMMEAHHLR